MKNTPDIWDRVRRQGKRVQGSCFTIYGFKTSSPLKPRIVVPLKVDKRSTVRNKVKRRIRDIISKGAAKELGLIVIVKPGILDRTPQALREELAQFLRKLA